MIQLVKDYRDNAALRRSFNELAGRTFGLDFEDWYRNGFWGGHYVPYSLALDGRIIANVSVNLTPMRSDDGVKHFLQLGTVMTDEAYRRRGYIRMLMEQIETDYGREADGIYLFANDSVLDFYPRFGFRKSREYQYSGQLANTGTCAFRPIAMDCAAAWRRLEQTVERNVFQGRLDMTDNRGLLFFHVTRFLRENVYYHAPSDTYVIAELENARLFLHNVFSSTLTELTEILALFGEEVRQVTLGFTPDCTSGSASDSALCLTMDPTPDFTLNSGPGSTLGSGAGFTSIGRNGLAAEEVHEEDCTLFIKGKALDMLEREKLRIPTLAHA